MPVSSLLNSMLPSPFLSGTIAMPDYPQPSRPAGTSSPSSSPSQLAPDTYTPAQVSGGSSSLPDFSQDPLAGYQSYVSPPQQAWQKLEQSMASGDIASAQSALNDYARSLTTSNLYLSTLTKPSLQFINDLTKLGTALSGGSLADAQSAFKTAQQDQPQTADQALAAAIAKATSDGANDASWMEDLINFGTGAANAAVNAASLGNLAGVAAAGSAATSDSQLMDDLASIEDVLMESNANVGDYLRSQGYAAAPAAVYVSGLDRVDTLNMLPQLANSIGQINHTESGTLTISNSGSASIAGGAATDGGSFEETTIGSMSDTFSYTLTKSSTDPNTGAAIVLERAAALSLGNSTQLTIGAISSSQNSVESWTPNLAYEQISAYNYNAMLSNEVFLGNASTIGLSA